MKRVRERERERERQRGRVFVQSRLCNVQISVKSVANANFCWTRRRWRRRRRWCCIFHCCILCWKLFLLSIDIGHSAFTALARHKYVKKINCKICSTWLILMTNFRWIQFEQKLFGWFWWQTWSQRHKQNFYVSVILVWT